MLPNHAPLVIAEQFGTLESLYPGRIDLGLGPRAGHRPAHAARAAPRPRDAPTQFPQDVAGAAALLRRRRAGTGACRPCPARARRAALDPRLEHLRRAARGGARAAVSRSRRTSRRTLLLPALELYRAQLPAVGAARARRTRWSASTWSRPRPTPRRAGFHDGAAGVHEPASAAAGAAAAARRRHRRALDARPRSCALAHARPARSSARPTRCARASSVHRRDRRRRADRRLAIYDHAARVRSYEILASVRQGLGASLA